MRSDFGNRAKALRARLGISQTEFAKTLGEQITRISNLEYGRTNIGEDVLARYVSLLCQSEDEAENLRELARFSNTKRTLASKKEPLPSIQALVSLYGDKLSEASKKKIRELIAEDAGQEAKADIKVMNLLKRSAVNENRKKAGRRHLLTAERFADIVLFADEVRRTHFKENEKVQVERLFEAVALEDGSFDYDVVENMPDVAQDSFACVIGDVDGVVVYSRKDLFQRAIFGNPFAGFAHCHEFGHFALHKQFLASEEKAIINLQPSNSFESDSGNFEYLASPEEEEAEVFATFLMVPFHFLFGKVSAYINSDYAIPDGKTKHCLRFYCRNPAVIDQLKWRLFDRGDSDHPIFGL